MNGSAATGRAGKRLSARTVPELLHKIRPLLPRCSDARAQIVVVMGQDSAIALG